MACNTRYQKSSLRVYSTIEQEFATPGNIVFQNIAYTSGVSISATANSDTIYLKKNGLYYITADILMANGTAATETEVQLYVDGASVPGAATQATLTLTSDTDTGTISAIIPVDGCCCPCNKGTQVTFRASGTTAVIGSINVNVVKLA